MKQHRPVLRLPARLLLCAAAAALPAGAFAQRPNAVPVVPTIPPGAATAPVTPAPLPANDPFLKTTPLPTIPDPSTDAVKSPIKEGLLRLEFFSLPPNAARRALRTYPSQSDLYQWVESQLEKEGTEVTFEHVTVLRVRGEERAKVDETIDYPFAKEFDPPAMPETLGVGVPLTLEPPDNHPSPPPAPAAPAPTPPFPPPSGAQGELGASGSQAAVPPTPAMLPANFFKTQTTPQSFQFRKIGVTFEAQIAFGENESLVDVDLALERTRLADIMDMDAAGEIKHPAFDSQMIAGKVTAKAGTPAFVGTFSPSSRTGTPNEAEIPRVWLLFLTVDPVSM